MGKLNRRDFLKLAAVVTAALTARKMPNTIPSEEEKEQTVVPEEQAVDQEFEVMDTFSAVGIAEGFIECDNPVTLQAAWQYLLDTGLCWSLQGWFGRSAVDLIKRGLITPTEKTAAWLQGRGYGIPSPGGG